MRRRNRLAQIPQKRTGKGADKNIASVLNPKFASFYGTFHSELRIQKDTSKFMILVWFWFRSSLEEVAETNEANF
jgi:hypothetical protein